MFQQRHQKLRSNSLAIDQQLPPVKRSRTEETVLGVLSYGGFQLKIHKRIIDSLNMIKPCQLQPIQKNKFKLEKIKQQPKLPKLPKLIMLRQIKSREFSPW